MELRANYATSVTDVGIISMKSRQRKMWNLVGGDRAVKNGW